MKTSLKAAFAQIFSCCPKKSELPKIWGGFSPPRRPPARTPMTTIGQSRDHHTDWKTAIYLLPHANRRNIVGQQLPTLLDATCCVRLHTLLHVVPCCWELLHPFAHHCQHGRNNSQRRWTNNVGSYCARLHTTANTDATTPIILGPTMLGVIASVCT